MYSSSSYTSQDNVLLIRAVSDCDTISSSVLFEKNPLLLEKAEKFRILDATAKQISEA